MKTVLLGVLCLLSLSNLYTSNAFPTKTNTSYQKTSSRNVRSKPFIANPYANTVHMHVVQSTTSSSSSCNTRSTEDEGKLPSDMKIKEIKEELRTLHVSYADCFERDSLVKRLIDARNNVVKEEEEEEDSTLTSSESNNEIEPQVKFDRNAVHQELRSLRVSELRTQLAGRGIRWGGMIEKEDLVVALLNSMEETAHFSSSGALSVGSVADVSDDELLKERDTPSSETPLLLDIYATWCGPCKFLQAQLDMVAKELGSKVRIAKIDSDKYPALAGSLRAEGLPTLIIFDKEGKEIARKEGALMKDDLIKWLNDEANLVKD